ncbi:MAG: carboxypeptidase-like regulatory domain-containing protein, partial [Bacteroidota bacterium]
MIFLIACVQVFAQNGNIRGFVYESESAEPVIFTSVILKGTTFGAQTDVNGYFSITKLPAGSYTLMITMLGHDTLIEKINLKENEILTKKLFTKKSSIKLKEFEISAEKKEQLTEVRTSVTKITPQDIKKIPSVGGEPDLAQYLQVLPGVIFTGDQGGQLYIRGGAPVQNKVLLDGMIIYNPFHSIGLFSVFDADYIRNA